MECNDYEKCRDKINDGDIVFVKGTKGLIVPYVVKFFTRSPYTHVGIAFHMKTGNIDRLMMVEAQGGFKRRIVNIGYYKDEEISIVCNPKEWNEEISEKALKRINQTPYGWLEAFYVGVREFLLKFFNIKIPTRNFHGEICSEFVADVYELPERNLSPQMLLEQLQQLGHDIKLQIKKAG